jgi:hypothetical protein
MMTTKSIFGTSGLFTIVLAFGCSGQSVNDVGDINSSGGASSGALNSGGAPTASAGSNSTISAGAPNAVGGTTGCVSAGPELPPDSGILPASAAPLVGTWLGYVENFKFGDQTDKISITFGSCPSGSTVVFGDSEAPPAATDAEQLYPPNASENPLYPSPQWRPYPGVLHTLLNATFSNDRLQFDVAPEQVFASWCELQRSYEVATSPGTFWCLPNWGSGMDATGCFQPDPATNQRVPRACSQLDNCLFNTNRCSCTAQACSANLEPSIHFDLNVNLSSSKADGSVAGFSDGTRNVHFTKQ